ncbi:trafficking protein particle complex subunit 3-like [Asparagus officinalis]|uniref:trafficking protein particle complex subunit 3-like n=1 Tax=Asparagus officinalis TaxID=4686 RepID=UPI00098E1437|nr:trafficking protein particle complex subunit 3-like [Asparagus officinalis]
MAPLAPRSGDAVLANVERVNAELFTLTYGAMVRQLLTDIEGVEEVNKQLDQMGYSIGIQLIDEFLAKSNVARCVNFKETTDVIAKVLMKTEVTWVRDMLHGDDAYALRVKLLQQVPEEYPYKDDE